MTREQMEAARIAASDPKLFFKAVMAMRLDQKMYFKLRDPKFLISSKHQEAVVDEAIRLLGETKS